LLGNPYRSDTMWMIGDKVELIGTWLSVTRHINYGVVERITKCYIFVRNEHGNIVKFHQDGKCLGWNVLDNDKRIIKA